MIQITTDSTTSTRGGGRRGRSRRFKLLLVFLLSHLHLKDIVHGIEGRLGLLQELDFWLRAGLDFDDLCSQLPLLVEQTIAEIGKVLGFPSFAEVECSQSVIESIGSDMHLDMLHLPEILAQSV